MNSSPIRLLLVEDNPIEARLVQATLVSAEGSAFHVETVDRLSAAIQRVATHPPDVILLDLTLPDSRGRETFTRLHARATSIPIVVLSGLDDEALAIEAVRSGAQDYLVKGQVDGRMLGRILHYAMERRDAERERARLTARLLQNQKMQALGQLTAGVAHEINNPIGYILSNLTTVQEYLLGLTRLVQGAQTAVDGVFSGNSPLLARRELEELRKEIDAEFLLEDFRKALDDCREGALRIRDIVRNLRDFTHPDEGERKPADLNQLLDDAVRICWNELKYKAEVTRNYQTLPPVECYPQRIHQVFVNLLMNAAQAIREKGEITLSTSGVDDYVIIRIRDTGCGIPYEMRPKLFEPFFTTKPVGRGTGLGLHIVYNIVKAHGGTIDVTSEPGQGTEFIVRLPLCPSPPSESGAGDQEDLSNSIHLPELGTAG